MTGIDLFCGAGGLSIGAGMAGVRVAFAIEADANAATTYAKNHPATLVIQEDIRSVNPDEIPFPTSFTRSRNLSVLFGGPPCQGFSTSNQRTRPASNPSNWLFREYTRFVRTFRPDWIVFENVRGILETEKGVFLDRISKELMALGYTLTVGLLNTTDVGIPQDRSRLFVVGSLHGTWMAF